MDKEELIQGIIENLSKCQRPALNNAGWKTLGLSHAQMSMLYLLFYHSESSIKEAADFLGITKSAVSQLLDPLVDKALVTRRNDPKDRRIVRVSLTTGGKSTLKKLAKYKFAGLRSALENLDHKELNELYRLHKKMATNI
jgi:MarR family transcriptional regulator, organic hydroperoxide resistance regulator